jgi:hypothetical protein
MQWPTGDEDTHIRNLSKDLMSDQKGYVPAVHNAR